MERHIHITELHSLCIMRWRGEKAYEKLQGYLQEGLVEVDLDGVELLSMSFLDGLVSKLIAFHLADKVTFRVSDPTVRDKLARIAGIRSATLFYRSGDQDTRQVLPKAEMLYKATFVASKIPALEI